MCCLKNLEKIDPELAFLEENWPSNLPTGIVHADLFNDNVFFKIIVFLILSISILLVMTFWLMTWQSV
ncbi:hypothetical protein RM11_0348 [Bartonella quintana RM-11]|nr:hypothetical protein RM11_0348 [Bartonella quintana RM-11]